jgi:hypothetical protein
MFLSRPGWLVVDFFLGELHHFFKTKGLALAFRISVLGSMDSSFLGRNVEAVANAIYSDVVNYCSKFMVLYHSLDLSHQISIGWLRGAQIHNTVATVHKYR